jgi:hypothetical protein
MIEAFLNEIENALVDVGVPHSEARNVAVSTEAYITENIYLIANEFLVDALSYAAFLKAKEFIDTADVIDLGHSFEIVSTSGKTDFSTDARQMLPSLLKNAKTAKDGSRYQAIPVGGSKSSFDREAAIASANKAAKELAKNAGRRDISNEARSIYQNGMNRPKEPRGGTTEFRVATSKQNPATQWVYPAQEKDMTEYLNYINQEMNNAIRMFMYSVIEDVKARFQ